MRYEIGDLVGAGGMGVVYRAFDRLTRTEVVVKFLREELLGEPVMRARFATEVRAVERLCHPNLARFVAGGSEFLVMASAPGAPLGLAVADGGAFELTRIARIGEQLLRALAHAHGRNVVHADVKSDNVLLASGDRATLIDFGVARLLDEPLAIVDPMVSGTPDYMAPEVILGRAPGPSADLYAVGVILYELLTGTTPFGGGTSTEIMTRHLDEDVEPPSSRRPDRHIPVALERVIMRALAKDPWLRFPSALAFATALDPSAQGTVSHAGVARPRFRPWHAARTASRS
jgi:serine/threonine-protein kinase